MMKRLVFCFDGTWNQLNSPNPTNVVITAQSVTPIAKGGIVQIIHYDPGVGTGEDDRWKGGLFGEGLIDKIADAYTFLVFNYEPGDELYVFGFSRGAFSARSFVGFIRNVGIVQRKNATHIADALKLYQERKAGSEPDAPQFLAFRWRYSPEICIDQNEDAWRTKNCPCYTTGEAPVIRIKYLGVWDTVAAMGVPADLLFAKWANRGDQYFDSDLTSMVVSGRHAVSIDEVRKTFAPTLWPNFEALNASLGYSAGVGDAAYQQKWFPGVHGSVGGGGDIRGLSDRALVWILDGAEKMGLEVDKDSQSPLFALAPNDLAAINNVTAVAPTLLSRIEGWLLRRAPRSNGPKTLAEVSDSAVVRWRTPAANLPEKKPYRPVPLAGVADAINSVDAGLGPPPAIPIAPTSSTPVPGTLYTVIYGDKLGALAQTAYGHADRVDIVLAANRLITDPDRIFVGQVIYLPMEPKPPSSLGEGGLAGAP